MGSPSISAEQRSEAVAILVEEVLSVWRELERVEDALPTEAPDRVVVASEIFELRRLYRSVTDARDQSWAVISASRVTIEHARMVLARARERTRS